MKTLITIIFIATTAIISAQQVVTWKGGTPGKENCWAEPRNWDTNRVPDEFSHVVIKFRNNGHFNMPVIHSNEQIETIEIHSRAYLTITEKGTLLLYGANLEGDDIQLFGGNIHNTGRIIYEDLEADHFIARSSIARVYNPHH
jgi:hypothetical protein